jgi:hypothetical protein
MAEPNAENAATKIIFLFTGILLKFGRWIPSTASLDSPCVVHRPIRAAGVLHNGRFENYAVPGRAESNYCAGL